MKLYESFLSEIKSEEDSSSEYLPDLLHECDIETLINCTPFVDHLKKYEKYFQRMLNGEKGPTAQFWTIYIFYINRVHRELERCVKTNDVSGYITVFPDVLNIFFALNRPNYARWGTLFYQKLKNCNPTHFQILKNGAFTVRRTQKEFSRSAVDLSLEQSVNRDSASQMKGIVAFRNSENAVRRWSVTMTQRALAVGELRALTGLEIGEHSATQCQTSRVKRDNMQMKALSEKIDEFCNPFLNDTNPHLINIATGQVAVKDTENYLLNSLKRGETARKQFIEEWNHEHCRFQKPVRRIPINNFAAQNLAIKPNQGAKASNIKAENIRDMFIRIVMVIAEKTSLDLQRLMTYPITLYPLSISNSDGTRVKTQKSTLMVKLETLQSEIESEEVLLPSVQIFDGGLVLHSVVSQTNVGTTYSSIARSILSLICAGNSREVHICFDKYGFNSIKDDERRSRRTNDLSFTITGPEQSIRQSGQKLLTNSSFKTELTKSGPAVPDSLFSDAMTIEDEESSSDIDEDWSGDSDSDTEL